MGCQLVPIPCKPCSATANLNPVDCLYQSVECDRYPWQSEPTITNFGSVLSQVLVNYIGSLNGCNLNGLTTEWIIDLSYNNVVVVSLPFFNGVAFTFPGISFPTTSDWNTALTTALNSLAIYGLDYYYTEDDKVVVFNVLCSVDDTGIEFKIDLRINFDIYCSS